MALAEILTPDGDGDEERGIRQLESYANSSLSAQSGVVRRGTVLFADPHYRPYLPSGGDAASEQERREAASRRNTASPSVHYMSGIATSSAASFGSGRRRSRAAGFGLRGGLPPILPGGGYGPSSRESADSVAEKARQDTVETPRELRITAASEASGHLIVSHSTLPSQNEVGPENYLG